MEFTILDFIQKNLTFKMLDPIFKAVTYSGNNGYIFVAIAVLLLLGKKTRKIGIYCLVALAIGWFICNFSLKPLIARLRPYEYRDIVLKIAEPTDFAFPSGHTTAGFAVAFVLFLKKFTYGGKKVYLYVFIYAALMAYTRLYFYVHFPSDIVGGVVAGYVASMGSVHLVDRVYSWFHVDGN